MKQKKYPGLNRIFIFSSLIFTIFVLIFVGSTITSKVILGKDVKKLCETNKDCVPDKTCCFFYGKTQGVCDKKEMCGIILNSTKQQNRNQDLTEFPTNSENDFKEYLLGILTIILMFLIIYHIIREKKNN